MLSLLYLAVAVLVPLAHARAEQASPGSRAETHLHAAGKDCPPPHDEQHCPTCQFAGLKTLPTQASPTAPRLPQAVYAHTLRGTFFSPQHPVRIPGSRAPPTA